MKRVLFSWIAMIGLMTAGAQSDWLIRPPETHATAALRQNGKDLVLGNGLLERTFRLQPNLACVGFRNLSNGQELLRSVKPEARITVDGKSYNIGGLYGQSENAYLLPGWVDSMRAGNSDFQYASCTVTPLQPYLDWKPKGWVGNGRNASGITVRFRYQTPALPGVTVFVNYEIYDGIPLLAKWLSVDNAGAHGMRLDRVVNEILGVVEEESAAQGGHDQMAVQQRPWDLCERARLVL